MNRTTCLEALLVVLCGGLAACAAQRPVLYPNAQLDRVGPAAAQRDIDDCMRRAQQYVSAGSHGTDVARDTAIGAGSGAAIGAAGGAVTGDAGTGAAVGAASGGAAGLLHGIFGSRQPDPVYQNFVNRCLQERGYEPIGWQ